MIFCTASEKGGVGKSTMANYLAITLAEQGKRVLVIDLDSNKNTTRLHTVGLDPELVAQKSIYNYFTRKVEDLGEVVLKGTFGVDLIPSSDEMALLEIALMRDHGAVRRFKRDLEKLDEYDFVFLDTPGAANLNTTLGIFAADKVLIPMQPGAWEAMGLQAVLKEVARIQQDEERDIPLLIIPVMTTEKSAAGIRETLPLPVSMSSIDTNKAFENAIGQAKALIPGSKAHIQITALAKEIVE